MDETKKQDQTSTHKIGIYLWIWGLLFVLSFCSYMVDWYQFQGLLRWIPLRAAKIERSRRMRSGEVHYLDHPLLGMVVKVTPWEEPEESQEEAPENGASEENTVNSDQ